MKLKIPVYVSIVFIAFGLISCSRSENSNLNSGLCFDVPDLPTITSFSETNYEDYEIHFPMVESAVYRHGTNETVIASNDPRLIRLLNFLAYSECNSLSTWQQGYLSEEDVNRFLSNDAPTLEVVFSQSNVSSDYVHGNAERIVICGDSYLLFTPKEYASDSVKTNYLTERWWPYGEIIMTKIVSEDLDKDVISYDGWGTGYWINIIEYAGFCDGN